MPLGLDPRTSNNIGVFFMPLETFTDKDIDCVYDFQIAHHRDGEGYSDNWFDMEDDQNLNNWMNPYGT